MNAPATTSALEGSATALDALLACAHAVGIDVPGDRLERARRSDADDPLDIARRLRVPVRPVRLGHRWWTGDSGPYLVRLADASFAAALPTDRGYRLHTATHAHRLTARSAAGVDTPAWSVMPRLPDDGASVLTVIRRALGKGSRGEIAFAVVAAIALAALGLVVPWLSGVVVGVLVPIDAQSRIVAIGLVLVLVAAATFGLAVVQSYLIQRLTTRIDVRATAMLLLRITELPMSFFRRHGAGDLAKRLRAFDEIATQLAASVIVLASGVLLALAGIAVMFVISTSLAGVVVGLLLGLGIAAGVTVMAVVQARGKLVESSLALSRTTLPLFTGIAKLRAAGAEPRMHARWTALHDQQQAAATRVAIGGQRVGILTALAPTLVTFAVVIASASGFADLGLGDFTSFVAAAGQTAGAFASMLGPIAVLLGMAPLATALVPILSTRAEQASDGIVPDALTGDIEISAVRFAYEDGVPDVLHDVSLRVRPGEFVAIVGPSGSGKSTLVRLIVGLEQPSSGVIRFDGQALAALDAAAVRRQIGIVVQSAQLATGTLLENIVGTSGWTEADAWHAARLAGIADDIEAMPMRMQTLVSDGASTFSGGQKQRIMLARALVREPRVVVLDEATSTLDNRSQAIVTESLRALGTTRIVVAHRLSTVMSADRVVVLEHGRITESGTYDELVSAGGLFAHLAHRQML